MLSAVIHSAHGYPAFTVGTITGTPEVRSSRAPLVLRRTPLNAPTPAPDIIELSHACCSRITTSMDYIFILTLAINESGADI